MKRQFYQSQYILNQVFENKERVLRATLNTSQDYLNAIFDPGKDAIRVKIDGGALPVSPSVDAMPESASEGQLCPVYNEATEAVDFYEYKDGSWKYRGGTLSGSPLSDDERMAVEWIAGNLDKVKAVSDFDYIVNVEDIVLPADPSSERVMVHGVPQDIDDDLNSDDDTSTPYRIDVTGYVMHVATYADASSPEPDRYYTRVTYESTSGGLGMSHIYFARDEYEYYSGLSDGKNILRVYYMSNATRSPIRRVTYVMNPDGTLTDQNGVVESSADIHDGDGDETTKYRIQCPGYVVGCETYETGESSVASKYYAKMVYESDNVHVGTSYIYMEKDEYDYYAGLPNGRNLINIYYVGVVFPASVAISETRLRFPTNSEEYVAIDVNGNVRGISDEHDDDADETTHVKITVNGFALDMDGYYTSDDKIMKRLIDVKMSYNEQSDTTDIYLTREHYEYVSGLQNGRNAVCIYAIGAGIKKS